MKTIFIIGGTGFMGQALIRELLSRGHKVEGVVRPGSKNRLPSGVTSVEADPLDHTTYVDRLKPEHTLVQLAGVAHPGPFKNEMFRKIDFVCGRESVLAAKQVGVEHFVYVSVAQPSPIMKAYVEARAGVEALLRENKMNASVLRPWYVIGPGRRWPLILMPLYWIFENQSATRESALRLGLVTLEQMIQTMVYAIEHPSKGIKVFEVPQIRKGGQ